MLGAAKVAKTAASHLLIVTLILSVLTCPTLADQRAFSQFSAWPDDDGNFFMLAVWLQNPSRAYQYKAIGINTYVGLWDGPTTAQLSALSNAGMYAICDQNATGLSSSFNDIIIGWHLPDEPDNAQSNGSGGYYSPRAPFPDTWWNTCPYTDVSTLTANMRSNDTTRPIMLNLGQGVIYDEWVGRGIRTNHPEDYPEYIASPDLVSFDIYPGNSDRAATEGKYWLVADGVDRLMNWSDQQDQAVFNCIETSNISGDWTPQPSRIKFEIWSSIIHGSRGLIYFCHEFNPFVEAGTLQYDDVKEMLTHENGLITQYAQVLNSEDSNIDVQLSVSKTTTFIDTLVKEHNGYLYIFSANMRGTGTSATYYIPSITENRPVEVLGEDRQINMLMPGAFIDDYEYYGVHIYRIQLEEANIPGDADRDDDVDIFDFLILKSNYGLSSGASWIDGDFDSDGDVDIYDFLILKANYGS